MGAKQLLLLLCLIGCVCCLQSMSVLTALGRILEQHLGYVRDVHYLRLDGSVRSRRGREAGRLQLRHCHCSVHELA